MFFEFEIASTILNIAENKYTLIKKKIGLFELVLNNSEKSTQIEGVVCQPP